MADDPRCEELFRDCERLSRECADEWCLAAALEGLGFVHLMRGSLPESRRIFEEGLEVARRSGDQLRGHWISSWLGWVMVSQGEAAGGMPILQATVADLRRSKDIVFTGFALMALGVAHIYLGNYAQGRECLDESHAIEKQTGSVVQPLLLMWNARSMLAMGEDATEVLELARAAHRIQSRPLGIQFALETVGRAELACGAIAAAREHLDDVIATYRLSGNAPMLATPLILRAAVSVEEGDDRGAETLLHEALALQQDTQDRFGAIDAFEALASIAVNQESLVEAVRLYGSAAAMRAQTGYVRFPSERPTYEARLNIAKEELGPEAFEAAWADGASLSMEEAIAYARRGRGERKRPSSGWDSVTPAEADVIALVAEGLTNPQIGERLFISKRTVQTHLYRIFHKLAVSSRAELAAEATRRQSVSPGASRK